MDAYRLRNAFRTDLTTAVFPAETLTTLYRTLGDVRELTFWIASAGQVLVLAAVLLGLYATLAARAQGLAALRAMGASRLFVWLTLWLQAMAMLLAGFAVGVLLAALTSRLAASVLSDRMNLLLNVRLDAGDFWPLALLLLAGAVATAAVAWRAYQAPLSSALRS
jgi:putative ABC transport system permease protein